MFGPVSPFSFAARVPQAAAKAVSSVDVPDDAVQVFRPLLPGLNQAQDATLRRVLGNVPQN